MRDFLHGYKNDFERDTYPEEENKMPSPRRRPGTHVRGNRISGSENRLNEKAAKVLGAIKFSPTSLGREEIMQETSFDRDEIERQVKLLLQLNMIKLNTRFPVYPQQGWRVYTDPERHNEIIRILANHNITDRRTERTRELLGEGYYPTGMDLEGTGIQENRGHTYVTGHPIIPELEFRPEVLAVMKKFRDEIKPFQPKEYSTENVEKKKEKWKWFVKEMSESYHIPTPKLKWGIFSQDSWNRDGSSYRDDEGNSSFYERGENTLYFTGKFSVTTLLHEYAHVRGFDERDAIIWSINLGMRIFPISFNKLLQSSDENSHVLLRGNREPEFTGG